MTCTNANPTLSCSTFQFKSTKTDSGHIENMIKCQLKILGKFSNKSQRCTMTPSNYVVSYPIFPCSVFSSSITKTISGHFDKWTKYSSKVICSCSNNSYRCPTKYPMFCTPRPLPDHQDHESLFEIIQWSTCIHSMSTHLLTSLPCCFSS